MTITPLTPERLQEIRDFIVEKFFGGCLAPDIATYLLAELQTLRADLDKREKLATPSDNLKMENDRLRAQVAELQASNTREVERRRDLDSQVVSLSNILDGRDATLAKLEKENAELRGLRNAYAEDKHADWCCAPAFACCCGHEDAVKDLAIAEPRAEAGVAGLANADKRIAQLEEALRRLLQNPHGCRVCDYGVLRKGVSTGQVEHDIACPSHNARAALASSTESTSSGQGRLNPPDGGQGAGEMPSGEHPRPQSTTPGSTDQDVRKGLDPTLMAMPDQAGLNADPNRAKPGEVSPGPGVVEQSKHVLVILESPYAGDTEANVAYARACLRDSLLRGEAPIASHLLYTQPGVLRDEVPEERQRGIEAGLAWGDAATKTVVYTDRGISRGMQFGISMAEQHGRPVEYRTIEQSSSALSGERPDTNAVRFDGAATAGSSAPNPAADDLCECGCALSEHEHSPLGHFIGCPDCRCKQFVASVSAGSAEIYFSSGPAMQECENQDRQAASNARIAELGRENALFREQLGEHAANHVSLLEAVRVSAADRIKFLEKQLEAERKKHEAAVRLADAAVEDWHKEERADGFWWALNLYEAAKKAVGEK